MTMIWDTGVNPGNPPSATLSTPSSRCISWCEDDGVYAAVYLRAVGGAAYFCYGYGNDNAWTEEILVRSDAATGRLGIQATVEGFSLAVDQNGVTDHVHIAWAAGGAIYHSELTVPTAPELVGSWTAWGANLYQQVDNSDTMIGYHSPAISVDSGGDPHIAYGNSDASEEVCYNYGSGALHAFTPANEITLVTGLGTATDPAMLAIVEAGRDLYVFWKQTNTVQYRYCPNANNPLLIASWAAAVQVLGFNEQVDEFSAAYWYDLGGPLCQLLVVGVDIGSTSVRSNWYDEGNINGWGGGWRAAPNGTQEVVTANHLRVTQVDANDFALAYVPFGGGVVRFGFTDFNGGPTFDFILATFYDATNSSATEIGAEERGREHNNYSFGFLHLQGTPTDLMFDLIRVNNTPTTTSYVPDNGARRDESDAITLDWVFSDLGQAQTKLRVQVQEYGGDWSSIVYDSNEQASANSEWDIPAATLSYNTHYEWRVKVWDDEYGNEYDPYSESDWGE